MRKKFTIVMADDDVDDQELMNTAFKNSKIPVAIVPVYDGIQLMDYLHRRYKFNRTADPYPLPDLIFLDLNMPLMDGFAALVQIKSTPQLCHIPVYIVTTSRSKADREKALELGAAGFYSKGTSSKDVNKIVEELCYECFH